jgi:hypothetical protein
MPCPEEVAGDGGRVREMVKEGKYTLYMCMKTEQ